MRINAKKKSNTNPPKTPTGVPPMPRPKKPTPSKFSTKKKTKKGRVVKF